MTLYSYKAPFDPAYRGNPDLVATSINTSGGIAMSRTSGQCPAFVQVSASAMLGSGQITANIPLLPYQDFEYEWDFGDPGGTETTVCPSGDRRGQTLSDNSDQRGPEAEYVYRSAGTYTITLTIRARTGGVFLRSTVTSTFTASAFSASGGTYYFDSVSGDDGNDGLSSGAPKQTIAAIQALDATADRQYYLKRGSTWDGLIVVASRNRWDAYGSGAKPILTSAFGGSFTSVTDDIVLSNLDVRSTTDISPFSFGSTDYAITNLYIDNCEASTTTQRGAIGISPVNAPFSNCGLWKCNLSTPLDPWPEDTAGNCFYFGAKYWQFAHGCYFEGAGGLSNGTTVWAHHIYDRCFEHSSYRWLSFGSGVGRSFCINGNWDNPVDSTTVTYPRWHSRVECDLTGGAAFGCDFGTRGGDEAYVRYRDIVIDGCDFNDLSTRGVLAVSVAEATVRDGYIWNMGAGADRTISFGPSDAAQVRLYRMKAHRAIGNEGGNAPFFIGFEAPQWTVAQQVAYNIIFDARANAQPINLVAADHANSLVDHNQYWYPNDSDGAALHDGSGKKTFAQWQAAGFDTNGSVADPCWTDPANGDFS